ncbi:four helix bundle protein [Myroides sp. 1354]|uniref:four helix bundle protein n=1 Tax=unclassified Myroides TaxID=2642485 RepID=UPI002575CDEC|nr:MULTISPECIES: four helix bundle protein [unclassified Myroides]MDM1046294.1 four helix bundle protein [Myroides sp. R163-1]MDM1057231.1 four helix bundle protein [Myroides sp. 1354]MDM1070440.1 four helix bundle protein [Myroides sp. 1372]
MFVFSSIFSPLSFFVSEIYQLTRSFPQEELYGLTNQLRRSAVSVPSNIAEGCTRQSSKELPQFLHIALGSLAEIETQLFLALDLGFCQIEERYFVTIISIRRMLLGLIKSIRTKMK